MEPIEAFGLAATIVQFIGIGYKIYAFAEETYHGGATAEIKDLRVIHEQLRDRMFALADTPGAVDPGLQALSKECHGLAVELLDILSSIEAKGGASRRKSLMIALRAWRKQGQVTSIKERLAGFRDQIHLQLTMLLKTDQSALREQIDKLSDHLNKTVVESNEHAWKSGLGKIAVMLGLLERTRSQEFQDGLMVVAEGRDSLAAQIQSVQEGLEQLTRFQTTLDDAKKRRRILGAISPDHIDRRFHDVRPSHAKTFEWIFKKTLEDTDNDTSPSQDSQFSLWLKEGSGIFHVEGLAGAGKSTLMKFLCQDKRSESLLKHWAGSKQLVFSHFFFWRLGDPDQRSLKGLIQGLLHSILRQQPELVPFAFPEAWHRISAADKLPRLDCKAALGRLIANPDVCATHRFCFFIDGLDEFDEYNGLDGSEDSSYRDLVARFCDWTRESSDVKLCVSSRDWELFRRGFAGQQRLLLQDLTRRDMEIMVEDGLMAYGGEIAKAMKQRRSNGPDRNDPDPSAVSDLVKDIVSRSEGVFLWVDLVLQSLRRGTQNQDSVKRLHDRLQKIPTGLGAILGHTLDRIDDEYQDRAATLFSLVLAAKQLNLQCKLSVLRYSYVEDIEENPTFAIDRNGMQSGDYELTLRAERMRAQLDAACRGLLVAQTVDDRAPPFRKLAVEFLHRSVQEFLEEESSEMGKRIAAKLETPEPFKLIAHLLLAEHKSIGRYCHAPGRGQEWADGVKTLHHIYDTYGEMDWQLVSAMDSFLLWDYFMNTYTGVCSTVLCKYVAASVHVGRQQLDSETLDVYATFIDNGYMEILHTSGWQEFLSDQGYQPILSDALATFERSPSYYLHVFLIGKVRGWTKRHMLICQYFLRMGADPRLSFRKKDSPLTIWEEFISQSCDLVEEGLSRFLLETMKHMLERGAQPWVWIGRRMGRGPTFYEAYFASGNSIYLREARPISSTLPEVSEDRNNKKTRLSLRQLVLEHSTSIESTGLLLALLPSEAEYEKQWRRLALDNRIVVREEPPKYSMEWQTYSIEIFSDGPTGQQDPNVKVDVDTPGLVEAQGQMSLQQAGPQRHLESFLKAAAAAVQQPLFTLAIGFVLGYAMRRVRT